MEKSVWMVFSVIRNVYIFINKNVDVDLFKKTNFLHFCRAPKFFIDNAKRIYNDIENGYYTYYELVVFLLYQCMMGEDFDLYNVKQKTVKEVMKLFTFKKLNEDLKVLKHIYKELKFKRGLKDYFEIKEDGTNIAFVLTKNKRISPVFFIRNYDVLTNLDENVINKEYKQFVRIAMKIKETLKRRS